MEITIEKLKQVIAKKGYKWFYDKPNFIGIRTTLDIPDKFNDLMCAVFKHKGVETLRIWTITTDPGLDSLKHPLNKAGCAGLVPGQYIDCWSMGYHHSRIDHRCLKQTGPIEVYRDNDGDGYLDRKASTQWGLFGINIHRASRWVVSKLIGAYSAGCQVFPDKKDHDQLMWICDEYEVYCKNKFTYTLIEEVDLS